MIALGLSNNPQAFIDDTIVSMEDVEARRQYVRVTGDPRNAIYAVPTQGMNPQVFQLLEYLRAQLEEWTPNTRYNQGSDASSLNKTATGINMIMSASEQRKEEIIRNFAETEISDLYRFLIKINQLYLDQNQVVRLQNDVIEFSPDDLEGDYDLSVDASSGVGARDARIAALTQYLRELWPFAAQIGAARTDQFVLAAQKLLRLMGIEDAEKYISMPMPMTPPMGGMGQAGMMGGGMPVGGAGAAVVDGGGGYASPGGA
jgi:hypothetical protein